MPTPNDPAENQWFNQTYTIGGAKFSQQPGFQIKLTGGYNHIAAEINLIQHGNKVLLEQWLSAYCGRIITVYVEAGKYSGYIDFYISYELDNLTGEGAYGEHITLEKHKDKALYLFHCPQHRHQEKGNSHA